MATERELIPEDEPAPEPERPRLIFSTDLDGPALLPTLRAPGVLAILAELGYGVAINLAAPDDARAEAVCLLNRSGVPAIACIGLPPEEGFAFNLRNYPRALACYQAFRGWAVLHGLNFEAVGLSIEPPLEDVAPDQRRGPRALLRRLWLARENILYPSASTAYSELIVEIHHDGYDVHTYQMPVIADDRRAGTTLIQRALDIVDLPSDLDVLMCSSSVPIDLFDNDLGGALIASYGENADGLGVGSVGEPGMGWSDDADPDADERAPLAWRALRRDLLLAAQYTDTIYVYSLEDCVERGLLPKIAQLEWAAPARAMVRQRLVVAGLRAGLFLGLVLARFGLRALAWSGWALAIFLLLHRRRARRRRIERSRYGPKTEDEGPS